MKSSNNNFLRLFIGLPFIRPARSDLQAVLTVETDEAAAFCLGVCCEYFGSAPQSPVEAVTRSGFGKAKDIFALIFTDIYGGASSEFKNFREGTELVMLDIDALSFNELVEKYRARATENLLALSSTRPFKKYFQSMSADRAPHKDYGYSALQ